MATTVVNAIGLAWQSEDIPGVDDLYMRVHQSQIDETGAPFPGAFKDRDGGMSTDWNKYSIPEETRSRGKNPKENAVISMNVDKVRRIPGQVVNHTPSIEFNNRAHTDVIGDKKNNPEVRVLFGRIYNLVIPYSKERKVAE